MSSDNQEGEFTEVHRKHKKRKTASSPTLPPSTLQRTRSSELPPETPTRPKTSTYKNQIPVILSGIDEKFQTWRQVMGELRQHHPSLRISKVKALQKGDLLVVGDSPRDAVILQSEPKVKAALGQNVRVSLPKAYQTIKKTNKCLVVKGVPTDLTDAEFKEFLDLNKISYAKAERYKSKRDGRILPMFQLEISDPAEAEALLSQNLMCNVTGIVYKVEEFRQPISVRQCFNCQCFGHSAQNCKSKQKCVICGENHSHKGCPKKEAKQPKCANCSGPHVASYKGCPEYKKQAFRQHAVNHQKSYAAVVGQNTLPQPKTTQMFEFTAEQLTKFVANMAIQIAQPQVCYPNPKQDMLNLKSSMCRKVSTVAKTILGVNITGKELFESIGSLGAPAPPKPFTFTSTQVNSASKTTTKPSTSKTTSPPKTSIKAVPKQPKSTT